MNKKLYEIIINKKLYKIIMNKIFHSFNFLFLDKIISYKIYILEYTCNSW